MSQVEFALWVLFGLSVVGLVTLQVRSVLSAARLGGKSAHVVVAIRIALVSAMVILFGYVVWVQVNR